MVVVGWYPDTNIPDYAFLREVVRNERKQSALLQNQLPTTFRSFNKEQLCLCKAYYNWLGLMNPLMSCSKNWEITMAKVIKIDKFFQDVARRMVIQSGIKEALDFLDYESLLRELHLINFQIEEIKENEQIHKTLIF